MAKNTVRESHIERRTLHRPHSRPQRTHTTDTVMDASPQGDIVAFVPTALDVLQVNNLISSFVQCLDNGDGRRLAALFVPGGTVNVSLCASRECSCAWRCCWCSCCGCHLLWLPLDVLCAWLGFLLQQQLVLEVWLSLLNDTHAHMKCHFWVVLISVGRSCIAVIAVIVYQACVLWSSCSVYTSGGAREAAGCRRSVHIFLCVFSEYWRVDGA